MRSGCRDAGSAAAASAGAGAEQQPWRAYRALAGVGGARLDRDAASGTLPRHTPGFELRAPAANHQRLTCACDGAAGAAGARLSSSVGRLRARFCSCGSCNSLLVQPFALQLNRPFGEASLCAWEETDRSLRLAVYRNVFCSKLKSVFRTGGAVQLDTGLRYVLALCSC